MQPQSLQPTQLNTLKEKIKDIRLAMLTSQETDGDFHSRPMYTHDMDEDGTLWFFTYQDSNKVREIERNNRISLTFSDDGAETYVSVSGTAEVVKDKKKIDELWSDALKTWFPNGKDDPQVTLLKIKTHQGEYWDRPGGKMMKLFEVAKGALTGQPDTTQRNEKFGEEPQ